MVWINFYSIATNKESKLEHTFDIEKWSYWNCDLDSMIH